jgi:translocation and assembly module TamB
VRFDGFGLNAAFSGNILAVEVPGKPTAASGELKVTEGKYRAYGQNLDIETGRLIYAGGPITAPALDVRAVRRPVTGILVGVQVRGSLKGPEFTLFSEPSMTQSEQLSYLVLGRPMDTASREEGSAVTRAAMALGVAGGDFLSDKFGHKFGVDEIGIDTETRETGEEAALVIGKYLSPQLYVSYGLGLFESVSTLRVRYSINSHWKLVTETTETESGGDLLYTIERGD